MEPAMVYQSLKIWTPAGVFHFLELLVMGEYGSVPFPRANESDYGGMFR